LRQRWQSLFEEVDVVLCPPMPTVAFRHEHAPERHVEQSTRCGHPDIRPYHRFSAADRCPHRFAKHWMDAGTAVLHFPSGTDHRFPSLLQ
jgi:Asp-tRNA(Asn)/Glu-tRNA(Gln) amidotransferase A subunit family amidase